MLDLYAVVGYGQDRAAVEVFVGIAAVACFQAISQANAVIQHGIAVDVVVPNHHIFGTAEFFHYIKEARIDFGTAYLLALLAEAHSRVITAVLPLEIRQVVFGNRDMEHRGGFRHYAAILLGQSRNHPFVPLDLLFGNKVIICTEVILLAAAVSI